MAEAAPPPELRALVQRLLDPARRWSGADDRRLFELVRADESAAAFYRRALARHRLLSGGDAAVPTGFELARRAAAAADVAGAKAPRGVPRWLAWAGPIVALAAAALLIVPRLSAAPDPDGYLAARGLPPSGLPDRRAGLGMGGVAADGSEYEIVYQPAHLDDWLRLSYTNERPELGWLFVVALQPERPADEAIVWLAPTPEEGRSLPIEPSRFRQLPFEIRLAARHAAGPVRVIALFTAAPITTPSMTAALQSLASSAARALPSELEADLRTRLQLSPRDVVHVLDTRIVPGSGADPAPGKEAEPR